MPKIQQCRNGCGQLIVLQEHDGKWKPFNVSESGAIGELHDCPNWVKSKPTTFVAPQSAPQFTGWTGTNQKGQIFQARVNKKDEVEEALAADIEFITKSVAKIMRIQDEHTNILVDIFHHFGLDKPEPASEAADIAYKEIKEPEFRVKTSEEDVLPSETGEEDDSEDAAKKEREEADYGF